MYRIIHQLGLSMDKQIRKVVCPLIVMTLLHMSTGTYVQSI